MNKRTTATFPVSPGEAEYASWLRLLRELRGLSR